MPLGYFLTTFTYSEDSAFREHFNLILSDSIEALVFSSKQITIP